MLLGLQSSLHPFITHPSYRAIAELPLADCDFEAIREMMLHPHTVLGLSDGGAHCGLIRDASMPTYLLTHWARDRNRGARIPLETAVHLQTQKTARVWGFEDRGTLEVGMKGDLNVIDHDALHIDAPEMVNDLPASGRRLIQRAHGYRATVCAGEVTFEDGEPTGALPGKRVRGSA
jgi:N-acyl-D-aspartate/D-glutamate deacylase